MRSSEAIRETYGLTLGERSASEVLSIAVTAGITQAKEESSNSAVHWRRHAEL